MKRLSALYKELPSLHWQLFFPLFWTVGFMHSEGLNLLDAIWYSHIDAHYGRISGA